MSVYPAHRVLQAIAVPHRLRMGLSVLRPDELWLDADESLAEERLEKERLLAERYQEVFVELAESRPAQREIADALLATLLRDYPDRYRLDRKDRETLLVDGDAVSLAGLEEGPRPPLELISRVLQEDLCVMERKEGRWCLSAASVCFPTRWNLRSKLGLPLDAIHDPVPGYREVLAASADRFFDGLSVGRTVWRSNWSLVDDPTLFQPEVRPTPHPIDARNAGEKIWWRLERQTLHRFRGSDAVLFTIRVYQTPLRTLRADKEAAQALAGAIRTMPDALLRYKSIPPFRDAVVSYLENGADS